MIEILLITNKFGLAHALEAALNHSIYQIHLVDTVNDALKNGITRPHLIILGETEQTFLQAASQLRTDTLLQQTPIMLYADDFSIFNEEYQHRLGVQDAVSVLESAPHVLAHIEQCLQHSLM